MTVEDGSSFESENPSTVGQDPELGKDHLTRAAVESTQLEFEEQSRLVRVSNHPIVQFVLGTAPWTGGLASLLSQNAQRRQEARLRRFLIGLGHELDDRFKELGSRIDERSFESDEFVAGLFFALDQAAQSADDEKLQFLRQFVISGALLAKPDITRMSIFQSHISAMSGTHLAVLATFYQRQKHLPRVERLGRVGIVGSVPLSIRDLLDGFPQTDDLLPLILIDLHSRGLIVDWRELGNSAQHRSEFTLSDSGSELMRFLSQSW